MHRNFTLMSFNDAYEEFVNYQLSWVKTWHPNHLVQFGLDFLEFAQNMIEPLPISQWGVNFTEDDYQNLKSGKDRRLITLWNAQSSFWAQRETPLTYCVFSGKLYELFANTKPKQLVSIGSGPGLYEIYWAHKLGRQSQIICTDISTGMTQEGIKNQKRYETLYGQPSTTLFKESDASQLFIGAKTQDAVISNNVLNWIPNWKKSLHEMHRVLKPGGVAVLSSRTKAPGITIKDEHIKPTPNIDYSELIDHIKRIFGKPLKEELFTLPYGLGQGGNMDQRYTFLLKKK